MTATLIQEDITGSAWDFTPVFTALDTPPTKHVSRPLLGYKSTEPSTPGLRRVLSRDDDDATPKATPVLESKTALGDFGQIISYLGYALQVTEPTECPTGNIDSLLEGVIEETTPTRATAASVSEHYSEAHGSEANSIAIKKAEKGRRAVLADYLGTSPESGGSINNKQKPLKSKPVNQWSELGLSPSTVTPKSIIHSRKHASMTVAAENKVKLILELHKRFPEDLHTLSNVAHTTLEPDSNGVHCFVDISNILIGFHDTLKRNRQINIHTRIPRQTLSFHNLSILLERGRPTAKRFLAGSDNIDCTQEARLLGYTTHILQRVDKPDYSFSPGTRKGRRSGLTSSDTDSGTPGRTRRAEQAVDEVLHLGMLQSLLDADKPSTIVLASGDAAKAEFSDGFLKQVERALLKGWKVEVMSFKATTGSAYRDPQWTARWGNSFRLIPLDDFAELLHIPYEGSKF